MNCGLSYYIFFWKEDRRKIIICKEIKGKNASKSIDYIIRFYNILFII